MGTGKLTLMRQERIFHSLFTGSGLSQGHGWTSEGAVYIQIIRCSKSLWRLSSYHHISKKKLWKNVTPLGVFEMPYIDLDISHFSIFQAPLGLLEMPYIDLDISHLSSTRAPLDTTIWPPTNSGAKISAFVHRIQNLQKYRQIWWGVRLPQTCLSKIRPKIGIFFFYSVLKPKLLNIKSKFSLKLLVFLGHDILRFILQSSDCQPIFF